VNSITNNTVETSQNKTSQIVNFTQKKVSDLQNLAPSNNDNVYESSNDLEVLQSKVM